MQVVRHHEEREMDNHSRRSSLLTRMCDSKCHTVDSHNIRFLCFHVISFRSNRRVDSCMGLAFLLLYLASNRVMGILRLQEGKGACSLSAEEFKGRRCSRLTLPCSQQ